MVTADSRGHGFEGHALAGETLAAILHICQKMISERDLDTLLDLIAVEAARLLNAERASLFLVDTATDELVSKVAMGSRDVIRIEASQGVAGHVFQTGETVAVADAYSDPRFFQQVDTKSGFRTRSLLAVPLTGRDGERIGTFEMLNKRDGSFTTTDAQILRSLAATAALSIQNAQLILELKRHRETLENENRNLMREIGGRMARIQVLGASEPIAQLREMIAKIADADVTVLVTGESGTGKDLVARSIHYASPRARGPYVALNCAALPETLVETELFGVEKGVATGVERRAGKFEAADGGTLFLDEIGDLSLTAQAKILRVLQDRMVERIGSHKPVSVDVRVIAATNKNLDSEIAEGRFREDLYYRLNVIHLRTPALREIREDIPLLAKHFATEVAREMRRQEITLPPAVMRKLTEFDWPGNARQLQNEMRRLVVCAQGGQATVLDMSEGLQRGNAAAASNGPAKRGNLQDEIEELERTRIREALEATRFNQQQTARRLGLSRQGLINKLKRYGIRAGAAEE